MGSVAEYYLTHLPYRPDFSSCDDAIPVMEKLGEVMMHRIFPDKSTLSIRYEDGGFFDSHGCDCSLDSYERMVENEGSFSDIITDGFNSIGNAVSLFEPVYAPDESVFEDFDGSDDVEKCECWIKSMPAKEVVNYYLYSLPPSDLDALPRLVNDFADWCSYDPFMEECSIFVSLFKSRLIGSFLSTTLIPEGMKKKGMQLFYTVRDPFEQRCYWDGVDKGTYVLCFLSGAIDYTTWINLNHLSMKWLPAVVCLKEEILRLNEMFHFYEEPSERSKIE